MTEPEARTRDLQRKQRKEGTADVAARMAELQVALEGLDADVYGDLAADLRVSGNPWGGWY